MLRFCAVSLLAAVSIMQGPSYAADPDVAWQKTIYVPKIDDEVAKTINFETGLIQKVIDAKNGAAPINCPPKAFWMPDPDRLVSCDSGSVYVLMGFKQGSGVIEALKLIPVGDPKPGSTDDPGPSKIKDALEQPQ